ncbi:MAG TPA: hypothetical protein LFV92_05385 [Rickettsia endosymbiont of Ceroptres masudai]|nr:hypothetical protein [Rickettsia endosymbiont of Ceroptres masudai]
MIQIIVASHGEFNPTGINPRRLATAFHSLYQGMSIPLVHYSLPERRAV